MFYIFLLLLLTYRYFFKTKERLRLIEWSERPKKIVEVIAPVSGGIWVLDISEQLFGQIFLWPWLRYFKQLQNWLYLLRIWFRN